MYATTPGFGDSRSVGPSTPQLHAPRMHHQSTHNGPNGPNTQTLHRLPPILPPNSPQNTSLPLPPPPLLSSSHHQHPHQHPHHQQQQQQLDQRRFPSPTPESQRLMQDPRILRECEHLNDVLSQARPEVLRQVLRNMFEKSFGGTDYHSTFIMNILLHTGSADVLRRSMTDFGERLVAVCKPELMAHFTTQDLDGLSAILIPKLSDGFLDKAMERRLNTIAPQSLVNALARANRLGYDALDIVEEDSSTRRERVTPNVGPASTMPIPPEVNIHPKSSNPTTSIRQQQQPPPPNSVLPSSSISSSQKSSSSISGIVASPLDAESGRLGIVRCNHCQRPCSGIKALKHHIRKQPCIEWLNRPGIGSIICLHCGQHFDGNGGLAYHSSHNVCGVFGPDVTQKMEYLLHVRKPGASASSASAAPPISQWKAYRSQVEVSRSPQLSQAAAAAATTTTTAPLSGDPYAALSPNQRQALMQELSQAEETYAERVQAATTLPSGAREVKLANLKNGLNNKQSMIRKKYGVRLRTRRTRTSLDAERHMHAAPDSPPVFASPMSRQQSGSSPGPTTMQDPDVSMQPAGPDNSTMQQPRRRESEGSLPAPPTDRAGRLDDPMAVTSGDDDENNENNDSNDNNNSGSSHGANNRDLENHNHNTSSMSIS